MQHPKAHILDPLVMVPFGDIARGVLRMQAQYAYRYLQGVCGCPALGDGLRFFVTPNHDYHGALIHPDDVAEFVYKVAQYEAEQHCISDREAEILVERGLAWAAANSLT